MEKEEMYESIKKYNETKSDEDFIIAEAKYLTKRVEYEIGMAKAEKQEEFGMGFIMAVDEFNGDKTILDFFAKCMISEICDGDIKSTLENYLHSKYNDKEEITHIRKREEIINFIREHDMYLSRYLEANIHLIKPLEIDIESIIFELNNQKEYDEEVIKDITDSFINMEDDCIYTSYELLLYLKHKKGIDILEDSDMDDDLMSEEEYCEAIFDNTNLKDAKILQDYTKLIEDYIQTKKEPDFYVLTEQKKKEKEKLKNQNIIITKIDNNNDENK